MEKYKTIVITNVVIFIGLSLMTSLLGFNNLADYFLGGVGAISVTLGVINMLIALFVAIASPKKYLAQGFLLCGGVLLLMGLSLCSAFIAGWHE